VGPVAVDPSCQGQGIGKLLLDFPETVSDNVVIGKTTFSSNAVMGMGKWGKMSDYVLIREDKVKPFSDIVVNSEGKC